MKSKNKFAYYSILLALAVSITAGAASAATITKGPDLGIFWHPLGPTSPDFTQVYANSFVAPASGVVTNLGMWLTDELNGDPGNGGADIRFEVYGSIGGNPANGPDTTNVLATTGSLSGLGIGPLAFYSSPTIGVGTPLVAGATYWYGGNTVGEAGAGAFQTGGHTQNSVVVDNGTFWFANDPLGLAFDGQGLTPEMAFSVTIVPEPGAISLAAAGLLCGLGFVRWNRRGSKSS